MNEPTRDEAGDPVVHEDSGRVKTIYFDKDGRACLWCYYRGRQINVNWEKWKPLERVVCTLAGGAGGLG